MLRLSTLKLRNNNRISASHSDILALAAVYFYRLVFHYYYHFFHFAPAVVGAAILQMYSTSIRFLLPFLCHSDS